jgi:hypothetical protein
MADDEFGKMLLAEIRRHHERIKRARESGYAELLEDQELSPTTTKPRFRVINGGRADRIACRGPRVASST